MELGTALNIVSTLAVVVALVFTGMQVREANRTRRDQASVAMIQAVQGDAWTRAIDLVARIPANAPAEVIEQSPLETRQALYDFAARLETVGYMVYRQMVEIETVDDLLGGVALTFWSRARAWVEVERTRIGSAKFLEWCEWITDRIAERHGRGEGVPGYLRGREPRQ